jgi:type III secretion protein U
VSEKSEQPTDKKLRDSKLQGQVAVSRDLARLLTLTVVAELTLGTESLWRQAVLGLMEEALQGSRAPFSNAMPALLTHAGMLLLAVFATFLLVCSVAAVVGFWGQFGILISPKTMTPKLDKLNPVNGVKQLFSKKKIIELLLNIFKCTVIGLMMFKFIREQLPTILQLSSGEPKDIYFGFIRILTSILHSVLLVCLVLAAIDFFVQKNAHIKSLRMDREEIKREFRESEGDPMVKSARKQLARQWANEAAPAKTEEANAVVVNPTHFAVALLYDDKQTPVPVVLAKGKDEVAQAMIARARECGIPVIRHVWLARTLYATCREDMAVPKASYDAVADVYAVVYELHASGQLDQVVELESQGLAPSPMQIDSNQLGPQ